MTTGQQRWSLEQLCERWPAVAWAEPIPVRTPGGPQRYACRVCIANHGLKGWEIEQLFRTRAAAAAHVAEAHGRRD